MPILSAIATLVAAAVSLYLGLNTRREKLKIFANQDFVWKPPCDGRGEKQLHVAVVNQSAFPVRVVGIGWKVGFIKKEIICQELKEREAIAYGESLHIWSSLDITAFSALKLQSRLKFIPAFLRSSFVKLVVITSGPRPEFTIPVPKRVFRKMMAYRLPTNIGGLQCVGGVPLEPKRRRGAEQEAS